MQSALLNAMIEDMQIAIRTLMVSFLQQIQQNDYSYSVS